LLNNIIRSALFLLLVSLAHHGAHAEKVSREPTKSSEHTHVRRVKKALANLGGVHPDIVGILKEALRYSNFIVVEGMRTIERQGNLVAKGASLTLDSKHLVQPDGYSHGVDIAPSPIDWGDHSRFIELSEVVLSLAAKKGIEIRWGGHWSSLEDLGHYELVIK